MEIRLFSSQHYCSKSWHLLVKLLPGYDNLSRAMLAQQFNSNTRTHTHTHVHTRRHTHALLQIEALAKGQACLHMYMREYIYIYMYIYTIYYITSADHFGRRREAVNTIALYNMPPNYL